VKVEWRLKSNPNHPKAGAYDRSKRRNHDFKNFSKEKNVQFLKEISKKGEGN
jgi:hypothetical protein